MIDEATALRSVPPLGCTSSVLGACRRLDLDPTSRGRRACQGVDPKASAIAASCARCRFWALPRSATKMRCSMAGAARSPRRWKRCVECVPKPERRPFVILGRIPAPVNHRSSRPARPQALPHDRSDDNPCESSHTDIAREYERNEKTPTQLGPRSLRRNSLRPDSVASVRYGERVCFRVKRGQVRGHGISSRSLSCRLNFTGNDD
jgi:hypothetical protein